MTDDVKAKLDEVLAILDDLHPRGEVTYNAYSQLHDRVSLALAALEAAHAVAPLTINGKAVTYNEEDGAWWAQSEGAPGWTAVANSRQELDALINGAKSFIEAARVPVSRDELAEIRAVAEAIVARTINQIGTHSTDCHEYHLPCFAWFVLNRISSDSGEAGR